MDVSLRAKAAAHVASPPERSPSSRDLMIVSDALKVASFLAASAVSDALRTVVVSAVADCRFTSSIGTVHWRRR